MESFTSALPAGRSTFTLAGLRHASLCDALLTYSQQHPHSTKNLEKKDSYIQQSKLVAMVSSKGKPTDPKLREEAKEGMSKCPYYAPREEVSQSHLELTQPFL